MFFIFIYIIFILYLHLFIFNIYLYYLLSSANQLHINVYISSILLFANIARAAYESREEISYFVDRKKRKINHL